MMTFSGYNSLKGVILISFDDVSTSIFTIFGIRAISFVVNTFMLQRSNRIRHISLSMKCDGQSKHATSQGEWQTLVMQLLSPWLGAVV